MKSNKKTLLIIIPNDVHLGVIESQMLGLAKLYSKRFKIIIAINEPMKFTLKYYHMISYKSYRQIFKKIKKVDYIYCRNVYSFFSIVVYSKIKSIKTIYDYRAIISFENFNKNKSYLKFLVLYILELIPYIFSNNIQCVSKKMSKKLHKLYLIKRDINVVPCLTYNAIKRKDPCDDVIKFVYVGSVAKWQMISHIINTLIEIEKNIKCMNTFVTQDREYLEDILGMSNLKNFIVKSGNNAQVKENFIKSRLWFPFRET